MAALISVEDHRTATLRGKYKGTGSLSRGRLPVRDRTAFACVWSPPATAHRLPPARRITRASSLSLPLLSLSGPPVPASACRFLRELCGVSPPPVRESPTSLNEAALSSRCSGNPTLCAVRFPPSGDRIACRSPRRTQMQRSLFESSHILDTSVRLCTRSAGPTRSRWATAQPSLRVSQTHDPYPARLPVRETPQLPNQFIGPAEPDHVDGRAHCGLSPRWCSSA